MSSNLIAMLDDAKSLLKIEGNDFTWSSWPDERAATTELDQFIQALKNGEPVDRSELVVLFAPTGPIQEVSLSSGWSGDFLRVADRFDRAIGRR